VDGQAEAVDALQTRFNDGLPRILDAIASVVLILVVRLAVRKKHQASMSRGLAHQQRARMAQRRAETRVALGFERRDALRDRLAVRLIETLDRTDGDTLRTDARERKHIIRFAQAFEC